MQRLRFAVIRRDRLDIDKIMLVTIVQITDEFWFIDTACDKVREGVTRWMRMTDEGKGAYEDSAHDFNIGDLLNHDLDRIAHFCPGIKSIEIEELDRGSWHYDTVLCDELETFDAGN